MSATANPEIDLNTPYTPRRPAPLISLSINHPIATAVRKIKNFLTHRQTLFATSFTIKITPIVAIVSLLGLTALFGGGITTAYNFGKTVEQKFLATAPTPTPKVIIETPVITTVSKTGTIKATYQNPPTPTVIANEVKQSSPNGIATDSSSPRNETLSPTVSPNPILHYILVSRSGQINYLIASSSIHLQNYVNSRVLITGSFNSNTNTLTVIKATDIEVLQ